MAILNQRTFELNLDRFVNETMPDAHLTLQKKITLDLFTSIVFKNPVGNPDLWAPQSLPPPAGYVGGRSRANWQIRRALTDEVLEAVDPNGNSTLSKGVAALARITRPYEIIWIFNNVEYIVPLEMGWSKQAPSGMVAVSIAEAEARFR